MTDIVYWQEAGVRNVMTAEDYDRRDDQEQLVEKFWRQGKTLEEARNLARQEVPDPTIISFQADLMRPLSSASGVYGHAGYDYLYFQLIAAGKCRTTRKAMKNHNLLEWDIPKPTEADIEKVFGQEAVPVFREYQKHHGLF